MNGWLDTPQNIRGLLQHILEGTVCHVKEHTCAQGVTIGHHICNTGSIRLLPDPMPPEVRCGGNEALSKLYE
eukprot:656811-Ditylum_brightwellii.AAC.1